MIRARCGGFTLVEVMVALVVMAIGVGGLLTALSECSATVAFARDHDKAVRLARRYMHYMRHAGEIEDRSESGEDGRFAWSVTVTAPEDEFLQLDDNEKGNSHLGVLMITVVVQWRDTEDGPLGHHVELVTYRVYSSNEDDASVSPLES